jgi:threonine dehydrogenase-like Zn-dependent dehydrogenase
LRQPQGSFSSGARRTHDIGPRGFVLPFRDGTLAEYVAVEARNLAPLPGDVDFTVGASLPISGLTAWQGLFEHGRLQAGQSVLVHGAAGAVGSMAFGASTVGPLLQATRTVPVVFPVVGDRIAAGFVASLARPGVGEADVIAFSNFSSTPSLMLRQWIRHEEPGRASGLF